MQWQESLHQELQTLQEDEVEKTSRCEGLSLEISVSQAQIEALREALADRDKQIEELREDISTMHKEAHKRAHTKSIRYQPLLKEGLLLSSRLI